VCGKVLGLLLEGGFVGEGDGYSRCASYLYAKG